MWSNEDVLCPLCGGATGWDKQDTYRIGGHRFTERALVCVNGCEWSLCTALFPWRDNPPMPLYNEKLDGLSGLVDRAEG